MKRSLSMVLLLCATVAACGGDSDDGGARGDLLAEAAAQAAAMDAADPDCVQNVSADGQSVVTANQICGDGNRIGISGQTGDNLTTTDSGHNTNERPE